MRVPRADLDAAPGSKWRHHIKISGHDGDIERVLKHIDRGDGTAVSDEEFEAAIAHVDRGVKIKLKHATDFYAPAFFGSIPLALTRGPGWASLRFDLPHPKLSILRLLVPFHPDVRFEVWLVDREGEKPGWHGTFSGGEIEEAWHKVKPLTTKGGEPS